MPDNVRILTGNRGKRAVNNRSGVLSPDIEIPDCPSHLLPAAKKEWKRVSVELLKIRIITQLDRAALAAYCQAYARWVDAETKLKQLGTDGLIEATPSGYKQIGVWLQISNRAVEQMHKFMSEFGMTPATRAKAEAAQVPEQHDLFPDDKPSPKRFFGSN